MEKRAMGAGRGEKPYGKRQPHPGTMKDWRGGYVGGKERQEMKSAGQSEVRVRRCCCRPSLTFILGMLITDRGERESGPPGTGEGPLVVVRAKLEGVGMEAGTLERLVHESRQNLIDLRTEKRDIQERNPRDVEGRCLGKGENLAQLPVFPA